MPLKKGKSKKVISENIAEIMHSYHEKGTIGTSIPATNDKAQKQAIAIAFDMAKKNLIRDLEIAKPEENK
jgi:hypothetical protein